MRAVGIAEPKTEMYVFAQFPGMCIFSSASWSTSNCHLKTTSLVVNEQMSLGNYFPRGQRARGK